ncbi:MAG: DUF499 domain-containing protein, partial [Promethearchaeota archaeon]
MPRMSSWYDIVLPYSVIQSGHIKENLFVADLGNLIQGTAPKEYSDPQSFFQRTYLTNGLIHLLQNVQTKICTGKGNEVIKLQTPFGGGKTHALITIYHYAANKADITNYLPKSLSTFKSKVVTIVGTNLNPLEGRYENDICIRTIWGDIAYQLAGFEGYKSFKANDMKRISPGKDKLVNFLTQHQPFLLLVDEIAEYISKARGVSVNESNLGTQTLIFLQELTEAITSLQKGLLVITLPVFEYEDFSEAKLGLINRISRILGRVESIETPIERKDLYRIITKKLIKKVLLPKARDDIISDYAKLYQTRRSELPERLQNSMFYEKMKDSYPFHPELIDLLFDKWRTLPSFQGTRSVLIILTQILSYLYTSKEKIDLILPSNINLHESNLKNAFLKHVNGRFTSILNSDVLGFDTNFFNGKFSNWNTLSLGICQTIFLNSFAQEGIPRGITLSELKMNLIRPDSSVAIVSELLNRLHTTLYYLHYIEGRYYFSQEANLNRKIQDLKELFKEEIEEELRKEIKKNAGKDLTTIIWPESSNEIPDDQRLKIVLIHPSIIKKTLLEWLEKKGTTFRKNKNTLIFALTHDSHLTHLKDLIQTKLALNEFFNKIKGKDIDTAFEIKQRQDRINETLSYHVRKTYSILYDGKKKISLGLPSVEYEPLTRWYHRELSSREIIVSELHYRKLEELYLRTNHYISTSQILEQFYVNPNLFKIESVKTLQNTICWGIKEGAFGRAKISENKIQSKSFFFYNELAPT